MTQARKLLVSLEQTSWYHVYSRCVKRSFLMGKDQYTGKSYEHRKEWVSEKLAELSGIYAIDIAAYAVMSNHYHLVLHINKEQAQQWSDKQVITRWLKLFKGNELVLKYLKNKPLNKAEQLKVEEIVADWRERLCSISWFMRCLNEHIARLANAEDKCTGRFWEGRFKSQALLDEQAILTCMAYVDLNPVRAGIADLPESSEFTAIKQRIDEEKKTRVHGKRVSKSEKLGKVKLAKFCKPANRKKPPVMGDSVHQGARATGDIPFYWLDYLELMDWVGRALLPNKRGAINNQAPHVLLRLGIDPAVWLDNMPKLEQQFYQCMGTCEDMQRCADSKDAFWVKGTQAARSLFG